MKNILRILITVSFISCKAQSVIIPLGGNQDIVHSPDYYEKDVNNEFGKYTGTWSYTNGDTELTFKLKKEEQYLSPSNYYTDMLVGEYKYIENGIQKVNTLSDFDSTTLSGYDHRISGGIFVHELPDNCLDNSDVTEIKIELFIVSPDDDDIEGRLILRYINDNGVEKIQVCVYDYTTLADDVNARIEVPDGYYEMVKQD
ncbi:DUF6705 family protein [Winogradskyella sp.]|uniref:DUF6705 family protein n=1 Tax=Winogradskyella sp. TaxID=1883156 RepID=UPI003F6C3562